MWGKIILGVFIVFLAVAGWFIYTTWQGFVAIKSINQAALQENIRAMEERDCSKIADVEIKFEQTKNSLKKICRSIVLRKIVEKYPAGDVNVCSELKNGDDFLNVRLNEYKDYCATQG